MLYVCLCSSRVDPYYTETCLVWLQDEMERFPLSLINDPTAVTNEDRRDIYNNILLFTVMGDNYQRSPSEMHIFQCKSSPVSHHQILKFEDMYTMQVSLFVYDLNNDLLPKSFRNLLTQNCLARHGIITRQNNLIPQSRPRTTYMYFLIKTA